MKILLLSQVFYPDVVAVAQYLTDLGVSLSSEGHDVAVLCSSSGYDGSPVEFPREEKWKGIRIRRVPVWNLGKKSKIRRILSFASFFASSFVSLMLMPRQDVVVVVPPPPLLSFLAAIFVRIRGGRLLYWSMDLNPDEAIAAGWMNPQSATARILDAALRFSLHASSTIVALDRFMKDRIVARGVPESKVHIVPIWSLDLDVQYDPDGRQVFRKQFGIEDKFVVMYSGNHSPLHPLDTVLRAALRLRDNPTIVFMFVGGGSEHYKVQSFAREHNLSNIICAPYQPLDRLAASLSSADLLVVLLGDPFVGIVHPSKIYNMLAVGAPFLYIGPEESHITDLRKYPDIARIGYFVRHGDVDQVEDIVNRLASEFARGRVSRPGRPAEVARFSRASVMPVISNLVEAAGHAENSGERRRIADELPDLRQ